MAKYLLDTNACIGIRNHIKGNASKDPVRRAAQQKLIAGGHVMPAADIAMSLVALGELRLRPDRSATISFGCQFRHV